MQYNYTNDINEYIYNFTSDTHEYIYHYTNDTKNYLKLPTFSKLANILPVFEHVASSQTNNYWPASISPISLKTLTSQHLPHYLEKR